MKGHRQSPPHSARSFRYYVVLICGLSLSANALPTIALQGKVIVGIGAFAFVTGPFHRIQRERWDNQRLRPRRCLGMVQTCRAADLIVSANAVLGHAMPRPLTDGINFFLRALNLGEIEGQGGVAPFKKELLRTHDAIRNNCA
jgi:hypothetical protein